MPSTGFSKGPIALTNTAIDRVLGAKGPGAYALGHMKGPTFIVQYAGRSDSDLNSRLKSWVGSYSAFKCDYATSPKAAFEKECFVFHAFGETRLLDNKIHPDRPANSGWRCPHCKIFT